MIFSSRGRGASSCRPVHTSRVHKFFVAAAAFVVSATLGVGVLVIVSVLVALVHIERAHTSGMGVFAGGVNHITVFAVPLLCGICGAVYVLRRVGEPKV
jgi:hypothetical protein